VYLVSLAYENVNFDANQLCGKIAELIVFAAVGPSALKSDVLPFFVTEAS
jgi:hypothetical protein